LFGEAQTTMADRIARLRYELGTALGRPRRENVVRAFPRHATGAEIGVFRGAFTNHLLRIARPRELHLIDGWWEIFGEHFPDWGEYTDFGQLSTRAAFEDARRVVRRRNAEEICTFHVADRLAALSGFSDGYFDWVYLDASHEYEETRDELELLRSKVKRGGVIAGDDWHEDPEHVHHGVCRAVQDLVRRTSWDLAHIDEFGQWCIVDRRIPDR
jgi:hypothetical protein